MEQHSRTFSYKKAKPAKTCAIVRYGALGDALQTSSVFPFLKASGYHITVYVAPHGYEVLRNDPHVDRFVVQDVDAIPNEWLGEFWGYLRARYDKFINFSESVERTLLATPGTTSHSWPYSMRRKHLNKNYLEFMHDIAEVPYKPRSRFYSTFDEHKWASIERLKIGEKVVLWCLGGSAVHKHYPHMDSVIQRLTDDDVHVVTVGDEQATMLERGLENNPLVHRRAWKWTIRESMSFAKVVDLVIGPETGMLNSVAFDSVPKVVFMSHSSRENLTRDWVNCTAIEPQNTACYPCHQLHYGFDHCSKGYKDGQVVGSLCQVNIDPDTVYREIGKWLLQEKAA